MFTKLAQKNVDHFNYHPLGHPAIIIAYGVVASIVVNKVLFKIADADTTP